MCSPPHTHERHSGAMATPIKRTAAVPGGAEDVLMNLQRGLLGYLAVLGGMALLGAFLAFPVLWPVLGTTWFQECHWPAGLAAGTGLPLVLGSAALYWWVAPRACRRHIPRSLAHVAKKFMGRDAQRVLATGFKFDVTKHVSVPNWTHPFPLVLLWCVVVSSVYTLLALGAETAATCVIASQWRSIMGFVMLIFVTVLNIPPLLRTTQDYAALNAHVTLVRAKEAAQRAADE